MTRPARDRKVRLSVMEFEPRDTPANLTLTGVHLVDANDNPIDAPAVGEQVFLQADWTASGLSPNDQYTVSFSVDGVELDSGTITGEDGDNLSYYWHLGGWYASPGNHSVEVTVDNTNAVAESDESDNTIDTSFAPVEPTSLPQQFVCPIGGTPEQDWTIINYVDVDPRSGSASDFRGGPFQYDGHDAMDIAIADFAAMDAGVPVYAAADGTVVDAQDGNFDRVTDANGEPANYVVIDNGNGWTTNYWHLRNGSVAVQPGDPVYAGELIGYVGSSGNSTGPHLHFSVYHDGDNVETNYDPSAYWVNPFPYQGDVDPTVMAHGVSSADGMNVGTEERPLAVNTFPTDYADNVYFWYRLSNLRLGDSYDVQWYQPDGELYTDFPGTATDVERGPFYDWDAAADWSQYPGTWTVALVVNGNTLASDDFTITDAPVPPPDSGPPPEPGPGPTPLPTPTPTPVPTPTPTPIQLTTGFAVAADAGGSPSVTAYAPDGSARVSETVFDPSFAGGVRTALADFNGDGILDLAVGTGPGTTAEVVVFDGATGQQLFAVTPFADFTGGVYVAAGDVTGDGKADLVVTPDLSGGPRVEIYRGGDFSLAANFFGINDPNFRGGARAAVGDLNGDGFGDVIVSAGFGGGPRVSIYDGKALANGGHLHHLVSDFFLFEPGLRNGAYVAAGDVDGDGFADLVGGGGPGGGPRVLVVSGKKLLENGPAAAIGSPLANFFAGDPDNRGGVRVAAKDLDGDGLADVVTGDGEGAGSRVTAYLGKDLADGSAVPDLDFDAFPGFTGGVFVG
jgi:murein DD-endopeptidase MepM/ murein hydrolase activator NlpD